MGVKYGQTQNNALAENRGGVLFLTVTRHWNISNRRALSISILDAS